VGLYPVELSANGDPVDCESAPVPTDAGEDTSGADVAGGVFHKETVSGAANAKGVADNRTPVVITTARSSARIFLVLFFALFIVDRSSFIWLYLNFIIFIKAIYNVSKNLG